MKRNDYGSLCTEMYEILHPQAPEDEMEFYLSYARKGQRMLEPMCGSGRFLAPFMEKGYDIWGMDASEEMLEKLRAKAPGAKADRCTLEDYRPGVQFDYIFIPSGSICLFTDGEPLAGVLRKLRELMNPEGRLVFAVDTVACVCPDDGEYRKNLTVSTPEGLEIALWSKNRYDAQTQTQYSPGRYVLSRAGEELRREEMDFQTHLYRMGEMDALLEQAGFTQIKAYGGYDKSPAEAAEGEMLLYECRAGEKQI